MKSYLIYTILGILLLFGFTSNTAVAVNDFSDHFSAEQIIGGAYLGSLDDQFHISFPANTYTQDIDVYISQSSVPNLPAGQKVSQVYSYYILTDEQPANDFELAIRFETDNIQAKHIWRYDYQQKTWQQLPTRVDLAGQLAIATSDDYHGRIVLMQEEVKAYTQLDASYSTQHQNFEMTHIGEREFEKLNIQNYNHQLYPEEYPRVSDIYQYDIQGMSIQQQPFELVFNYQVKDWLMPTAFFWDNSNQEWQSLPTTADLDKQQIIAQTVLPFSRVALFMVPHTWAGEASWYRYKDCNCAASRDYPRGTQLKLTHLSTGKQQVVTVNDYGPELWTNRIIDLDATVFEKFITLGAGVTDVKIELVK